MKMFYFTDPMCSWCHGFSPVIKKLKENYPEIDLEIISGGFSPGSTQKVTKEYKDFLEFHWRNVNQRSGQYFDHSMKFVSDTFVYDTEPSSRALVVIQSILPHQDFEFLSLMQQAFYVDGKDITDGNVLATLAEEIGVEKQLFLDRFNSQEMKQKTSQGFQFSRQLGVQGFPTLLTLQSDGVKVISHGFQDYDSLKISVDKWLQSTEVSKPNSDPGCTDDSCQF